MEQLLEVGVLAHPVAVAPDVDDLAVTHETVDERAIARLSPHATGGLRKTRLRGAARTELYALLVGTA
jgi:hypothetical protein